MRRRQARAGDRAEARGLPFPGRELPRAQWTRTRVPLGGWTGPFDWERWFSRAAPHVLDLGCGNGRSLVASALARPGLDHLGIDLVPQAVRHASMRAGHRGLPNCKFGWGDATAFVVERCAPATLREVHLLHPQPWRERLRGGRRQLDPEVLLAVWRALEPGGLFVFQTDHAGWAAYARRVVPALFDWRERDGPWPDAPQGRTLREFTAMRQGLAIVRAEAVRLAMDDAQAAARAGALPEPDFDARR